MNPILRFFTEMDASAARAWWITMALLGAVGCVLTVGVFFIDVEQSGLSHLLRSVRGAWWAPGAVTLLFTVLAFVGAPQIVLIAATAAVFGPVEGVVLSWIATMISAGVGFYIGRAGGAATLDRMAHGLVERIRGSVAKNGFLAAFLIRLIPSGPFILVNMALGATGMRASWFFGGAGLGIVPKILVVAFAGHGVSQIFAKDNIEALIFLLGAALAWLAIVFVVRPMLRKARGGE
ncbi:MAG: TVP38/TMEM64 family protein [Hyphomonadaceae bacterium]